jgi:hypothetical protein
MDKQPTKLKTKNIYLGKGMYAIVDERDFDYLSQFKWVVIKSKKTYYARTSILMHRLVLHAPVNVGIDHKNHDGLDNRRSNIRLATNSQNAQNRGLRKDNKTGYKGVFFNKKYRVFQTHIMIDGKYKYGGSFKTAKEAGLAYNYLATKHYGDFASLNNIL